MNYDRYASGITQHSERPPKAGWTVTDLDNNKKARNSGLFKLAEREGLIRCFAAHPFGAPAKPASCADAKRRLVEPPF